MKTIQIEGELLTEVKKQLDTINSGKRMVDELANTTFHAEKKLWQHMRKEFPDMSENCSLDTRGDDIFLIDRLRD